MDDMDKTICRHPDILEDMYNNRESNFIVVTRSEVPWMKFNISQEAIIRHDKDEHRLESLAQNMNW
jgi:hypothetical protein